MTVIELNEILRRELGSNLYGEGMFSWRWSEDLFWPAVHTGNLVPKKIEVPLVGGGVEETEIMVPEYKRVPQSLTHRNCWTVCKWLSPAVLAGLARDIFVGQQANHFFPEDVIKERWERIFPGSEYPSRGVHFMTDYRNKPFVMPTFADTQFLIKQLREQMSGMSEGARLKDEERKWDEALDKKRKITEDICENEFTAFLNPFPGSRGGFVSFGGTNFTKESSKSSHGKV